MMDNYDAVLAYTSSMYRTSLGVAQLSVHRTGEQAEGREADAKLRVPQPNPQDVRREEAVTQVRWAGVRSGYVL
jgi:hypothetical protein